MRDLPQRRSLLLTALAMLELDWRDSEEPAVVTALRGWLGSWRGLGHVAYGMHAQGVDLELKEFPHGWSASFYPTGIAHSIVQGSGWSAAPWRAVQRAALETLTRLEPAESPLVEEESPE